MYHTPGAAKTLSLSSAQTWLRNCASFERCCTAMRKEMIIRMQPDSDKGRAKALKVAASVSGVESVTVAGDSRDMLLVIGDGVDAGKLTRKLKKEVGEADILELRTVPATGSCTSSLAPGSSSAVATQSAYQRHTATPGRSVPGGGRIECPVAAAARWPGEHDSRRQAVGYYHHRTPSPGCYHQQSSPMVGLGQGGYGYTGARSYALEVARSHPANYSPMIARHDFRAVGRPAGDAGGGRREHGGGGGPNCCSIL